MSLFDGSPKPAGYWYGKMRDWAADREVRLAWEREHPEMAAAWNAAMEEDQFRHQAQRRAMWETFQREQTEAHLVDCGAPREVAALIQRGVQETDSVVRVAEFMEKPTQTFLLLFGDPASGKTVAACTAFLQLKAAIDNSDVGRSWEWFSKSGVFVSAHDVSNASYFDIEAKQRLQRMARVRLLILDDLGAEMMSEGWKANFDALIDARYGNGRKTILTSNVSAKATKRSDGGFDPSKFEERYGARAARRIREKGSVYHAIKRG